MVLTADQKKTLDTAARPLIKWLNENCHPNVKIIVDGVSAELLEGVAMAYTLDYATGNRPIAGTTVDTDPQGDA